jgi:hypothetical protein
MASLSKIIDVHSQQYEHDDREKSAQSDVVGIPADYRDNHKLMEMVHPDVLN